MSETERVDEHEGLLGGVPGRKGDDEQAADRWTRSRPRESEGFWKKNWAHESGVDAEEDWRAAGINALKLFCPHFVNYILSGYT